MNESVSIIVAAYQEEDNIEKAIDNALDVLRKAKIEYELIVIDDGSTDKTGLIVNRKAKENKKIRVVHHKENKGFGYSIKEGINLAKGKYITGFPGDNDTSAKLLIDLINRRKEADVILAYTVNPQRRTFFRRIISVSFTKFMNLIFGLNLRYYNGYFICKLDLLKKVKLHSKGLAIFAEAKVRLIKNGASFVEIPFEHTGRMHNESKAVSLKSVKETLGTIISLITKI